MLTSSPPGVYPIRRICKGGRRRKRRKMRGRSLKMVCYAINQITLNTLATMGGHGGAPRKKGKDSRTILVISDSVFAKTNIWSVVERGRWYVLSHETAQPGIISRGLSPLRRSTGPPEITTCTARDFFWEDRGSGRETDRLRQTGSEDRQIGSDRQTDMLRETDR